MEQKFILSSALLALLSKIDPILPILGTLSFLLIVDFALSVWAASNKKEPLPVKKEASQTGSSFVIYTIVILSAFFSQKYLFGDTLFVVKWTATAFGIIEITNIYRNAGRILGQPIFDFLIEKLISKNRNNKGEK